MNDGIGGDLFAIVYEAKTGKLYGLNSSGWAPAGLTPEFLASKGITAMPQKGIHSVTVPGAVDGWEKLLTKFGKLNLADVLAPAIGYDNAANYYPVVRKGCSGTTECVFSLTFTRVGVLRWPTWEWMPSLAALPSVKAFRGS